MKKVLILGSTGSIGKSTLDVILANPNKYEITALVANTNEEEICTQANKFNVKNISLASKNKLDSKYDFDGNFFDYSRLDEFIASDQVDIVVAAISGVIGLKPILSAIKAGKRVLIANKEPLVVAGKILMQEAKLSGAEIIPIDSEHCAIHQCLSNIHKQDLNKIIITCSGGPFLGKSLEELRDVSAEDAKDHPVWSMGNKNLIDSATLMNKALELIEARWLFDVPEEKIEIIIHPQSIIHSMIETKDSSVLAALSEPDMKVSIAYGLAYPDKINSSVPSLDLAKHQRLEFISFDKIDLPSIKFARNALSSGEAMPAVMNSANEVAVDLFLKGKLSFTLIFDTIKYCMDEYDKKINKINLGIDDLIDIDQQVRKTAMDFIKKNI
jgi:1-deoxy-D-xylulose-5-phosphate reductoisomerase